MRSTLTALKRSLQRIKDNINAPTKKTPTKMGVLTDGLFALTDLVADYEKVLRSIKRTEGDSGIPPAAAPDASGVTRTASGGSFTVEE